MTAHYVRPMATTDEIRATIDQYVKRFCAGDARAWSELFSADAVHEDPVGTPVNKGRSAVQTFYENTSALFGGGMHVEQTADPVIVGHEAIVFLTATGGEGENRARVPRIIDHMTFADDALHRVVESVLDHGVDRPRPRLKDKPTHSTGRTLATATRWLVRLLTFESGVLVATGIWLFFFYRPSMSAFGAPDRSLQLPRVIHRWAAVAAIPTLLAIVILAAVAVAIDRTAPTRVSTFVVPIAGFIAALVAVGTGVLLPWDQLALRAVTVGTNLSGYRFVLGQGPDVRFVLTGGNEVDTGTVASVLAVHVGAALAVVGAVADSVRPRRTTTPLG